MRCKESILWWVLGLGVHQRAKSEVGPQATKTPRSHLGLAQNYGTNDPQMIMFGGKPSSYWGLIILSHSHLRFSFGSVEWLPFLRFSQHFSIGPNLRGKDYRSPCWNTPKKLLILNHWGWRSRNCYPCVFHVKTPLQCADFFFEMM